MNQPLRTHTRYEAAYLFFLAAGVSLVYYFSNPNPSYFYDYTLRIAEALLHGRLGLIEAPPSWLNEMVPHGGLYYSVFPLGSVLTMLPVALLKAAGFIQLFPARAIASLVAGMTTLFFFLLSAKYHDTLTRRVLLTLFPVLGTLMWCNLAFAGAWQLALGWAALGQAAALYFTLIKRQPLLAGFFFALAFGNRTEVLLTTPIFMYLLTREAAPPFTKAPEQTSSKPKHFVRHRRKAAHAGISRYLAWAVPLRTALHKIVLERRAVALFVCFPFILGVLTLAYNYARFGSPADFGYARIPGILQEPWYQNGIFSLSAIPLNAEKMLFELWKRIDQYPYYVPTGFGGSIFLTSPLLFLLFRRGARDRGLKVASWVAIALLTFLLWCHGNPGGWQFSYRYAIVLFPWMFLILLESGDKKSSPLEVSLFAVSVLINLYATYLFLWTNYVKP